MDESTGCVKCAIAVKDKHNCHIRLDVGLADIKKAAEKRRYPFLKSYYWALDETPAKEEEDLLSPEEVARIKRKIESYAPWMDVDPEVPSRLLTDALPPTAAAPRAHAADLVSACGRPLRVPRRRVRTAKTRRRRRWTR